ncbi:MAG: hypothetical protein ABGY22_11945 [Acidimicrobiales bacterium]|jgi:hypothetical protein
MADSEHFNIDINDLTIAEVVEIEDRTGLPLDAPWVAYSGQCRR